MKKEIFFFYFQILNQQKEYYINLKAGSDYIIVSLFKLNETSSFT